MKMNIIIKAEYTCTKIRNLYTITNLINWINLLGDAIVFGTQKDKNENIEVINSFEINPH